MMTVLHDRPQKRGNRDERLIEPCGCLPKVATYQWSWKSCKILFSQNQGHLLMVPYTKTFNSNSRNP